jgi:hypothetical protein
MVKTPDRPKQDKDAGLPRERLGGRFVTKYEPDVALQILERIAEGETIAQVCAKGTGMPHPVTFKRWILNNPELAKAYDVALRLSAGSLEEEALDTAREIKRSQRDGTQVRAFEVLLGQLRWSASRRDPAKFGDKAPVNVRIPIQINTTLDLGDVADDKIAGKSIYNVSAVHKRTIDEAITEAESVEITIPLVKSVEKP